MRANRKPVQAFLCSASDFLFLVMVSVVGTMSMHWIHELRWNLAFSLVVGMVVAMAIQIPLGLAVSPLLGTIESLVPSMAVAMLSPMVVCTLHLLGYHPASRASLSLGVLVGIGDSLFLWTHARLRERRLRMSYLGQAGWTLPLRPFGMRRCNLLEGSAFPLGPHMAKLLSGVAGRVLLITTSGWFGVRFLQSASEVAVLDVGQGRERKRLARV